MKKVLIIGSKGMLGMELVEIFSIDDYEIHRADLPEIDITDSESIQSKFSEIKPDIVINAAAFTDVDGCEKQIELCHKVNGEALEYLAKECNKIGATLTHYSTDYVFDGGKEEGYTEDDQTNPQSQYGKSKELGEKNLQKYGEKYYIIRLSWLFGQHGNNFVETMLKLGQEKDKLEVVNDQFGKPTYAKDLAERTKELLESGQVHGIYHITNEGVTSWYDFTREIFKLAGVKISVEPVTTDKFPRPAKRPHYSGLINTKLPKSRPWQEALRDYLDSK
ncbi:MAG: dTDP-4-dehydrorhamnose reductase [Parcubacteria group bacterium]|nr:dTDP-4-dehydrorhamnose reductase [Parcubacteria group bacterium]